MRTLTLKIAAGILAGVAVALLVAMLHRALAEHPAHAPHFGPPHEAPSRPLVGLVLSLVALVVTAVGLTAWPLARRIRALQRGIRAIGEGQYVQPVPERGRDALGDLARSMNGMAQRIARSLSDRDALLQAVSHELGTPLSRMRFQLDLLEGAPAERRGELTQALVHELDELDRLSSELVSWAEADGAPLATRAVDAEALLRDALDHARAAFDKPLSYRLTIAPEAVARPVDAEPRQLERVIDNILRNAARHARTSVEVRLDVADAGHLEVTVSDDGEGIPEAERERVLEPFVRLDKSRGRGRGQGGSGLGLAIARRIVERHGGRIWIDAAPSGGAAVHTTWPTRAVATR